MITLNAVRPAGSIKESQHNKRLAVICLLAMATLSFAGAAYAQGVQTGIITGTVVDTSNLVLPGVTVTVASPALQGVRNTLTDGNGVYLFRGLPAGTYEVTFELTGMRTVKQQATVELGKPSEVLATLGVEGIAEVVNVTADTVASTITSTTGGANYTNKEIDALPTPRTIQGIATLAPGLTTNTPNVGQVTISGAFAYDNVFLVDGVDINDNVFGTSTAVFVEDAIEETQVLTSGISAEYGRFAGGVINAVTKSGGDIFSGSYRASLTNDSWQTRSPFEKSRNITRPDKINYVHEGTVGGPILKTKLWFFGSGRYFKTQNQRTLDVTGFTTNVSSTDKRGEIKLTGTLFQDHTLFGSYFKTSIAQIQPTFTFTIDPTIVQDRTTPSDRWVVGYRGVLSPRLFAEARWSQKKFGFRNSGGSDTNIVSGSPFFDVNQGGNHYNALYFDATDPEDRNNWQVAGSLSYFATTPSFGSHDLKGGIEIYNSHRTGGNSQSPTNYVFESDYVADAAGIPILANGKFIPVFTPGDSYLQEWLATRGAVIDIRTTSFYLQDGWKATRNLSFDVGVRYEKVRGEATGDLVPVNTDTWVPRTAVTYDVKGDGRFVAQATYAWYSGKYNEAQFGGNTDVGNPGLLYSIYTGPAGQGLNFAPGFDPNNYEVFYAEFPTANVFFAKGLSSPVNQEFTASLGAQLGRGYLKGTYVQRSVKNFVEDFTRLSDGSTTIIRDGVDYGTFSNVVYENSDEPKREYKALQFIGRYPFTSRWSLNANYTYQIDNNGTFEGEGTNTPGISSLIGDYPEIYDPVRNNPDGRLNDYQAHKVRLWTIYSLTMGRVGTADLSLLYRYDSGTTYSLAAASVPLTAIQNALGSGYASLPSNQTLYFGERGSEFFEGAGVFDFGLTYQVPLFKTLRPYVKFDAFNILNEDKLWTWNTTVRADNSSPRDRLGLPTGYTKGAQFGNGTSNANYLRARAWQISLGFRF